MGNQGSKNLSSDHGQEYKKGVKKKGRKSTSLEDSSWKVERNSYVICPTQNTQKTPAKNDAAEGGVYESIVKKGTSLKEAHSSNEWISEEYIIDNSEESSWKVKRNTYVICPTQNTQKTPNINDPAEGGVSESTVQDGTRLAEVDSTDDRLSSPSENSESLEDLIRIENDAIQEYDETHEYVNCPVDSTDDRLSSPPENSESLEDQIRIENDAIQEYVETHEYVNWLVDSTDDRLPSPSENSESLEDQNRIENDAIKEYVETHEYVNCPEKFPWSSGCPLHDGDLGNNVNVQCHEVQGKAEVAEESKTDLTKPITDNWSFLCEELDVIYLMGGSITTTIITDEESKVLDEFIEKDRYEAATYFLQCLLKKGQDGINFLMDVLTDKHCMGILNRLQKSRPVYRQNPQTVKENIIHYFESIVQEIDPIQFKDTFMDRKILDNTFFTALMKSHPRRRPRVEMFLREVLNKGDNAIFALLDVMTDMGYDELLAKLVPLEYNLIESKQQKQDLMKEDAVMTFSNQSSPDGLKGDAD